jgi:hypothetical protein
MLKSWIRVVSAPSMLFSNHLWEMSILSNQKILLRGNEIYSELTDEWEQRIVLTICSFSRERESGLKSSKRHDRIDFRKKMIYFLKMWTWLVLVRIKTYFLTRISSFSRKSASILEWTIESRKISFLHDRILIFK